MGEVASQERVSTKRSWWTIAQTAMFWIAAPSTVVSTIVLVYPKVSISVGVSTDPGIPISNVFLIKNDGYVPVYDLNLTCHLLSNTQGISFLPMSGKVVSKLSAGDTAPEICRSRIYNPNDTAIMEVKAEYKAFGIWRMHTTTSFEPIEVKDGFALVQHVEK